MSKTKLMGAIAILPLTVALLAGCTDGGETETLPTSSTPSTEGAHTPSPPAASDSPEPSADDETPIAEPKIPVDSGATDSASGTVEDDENGRPYVYVVAEGDTAWGIEQRFGIDGLADRYNRYLVAGEKLSLVP